MEEKVVLLLSTRLSKYSFVVEVGWYIINHSRSKKNQLIPKSWKTDPSPLKNQMQNPISINFFFLNPNPKSPFEIQLMKTQASPQWKLTKPIDRLPDIIIPSDWGDFCFGKVDVLLIFPIQIFFKSKRSALFSYQHLKKIFTSIASAKQRPYISNGFS